MGFRFQELRRRLLEVYGLRFGMSGLGLQVCGLGFVLGLRCLHSGIWIKLGSASGKDFGSGLGTSGSGFGVCCSFDNSV